jgi:hypothetical protein
MSACRDCGARVLWLVTLRGNRQAFDAHPDAVHGTVFVAAADNEKGSRLAIHAGHLKTEQRQHAVNQGLRLYRPHMLSCAAGSIRQRRVKAA